MKRKKFFIGRLFALMVLTVGSLPFFLAPHIIVPSQDHLGDFVRQPRRKRRGDLSSVDSQTTVSLENIGTTTKTGCAICFFGLPRSFQLLVLPSILKNILIPNKKNKCDIFMHYYEIQEESGGRSGYGGSISPEEALLIKDAVKQVYNDAPTSDIPRVAISMDTNEDFWEKRGKLLEKYRKTKGADGRFLYYPWNAKSYTYPTSVDNIVKQWHSIQSAWDSMEENAILLHKNYTHVAMLRNDVVYVTPFDIYQIGAREDAKRDLKNPYVAIPNYARYPINDRMIFGAYNGVKIWATERFIRLEDHVLTYEDPGYGMHSERFLNHSIFPAIREQGIEVLADPDICFLRARADGSTWINDCNSRNGAARGFRKIDVQLLVEDIVGRPCKKSKFNKRVVQLHCNIGLGANETTV